LKIVVIFKIYNTPMLKENQSFLPTFSKSSYVVANNIMIAERIEKIVPLNVISTSRGGPIFKHCSILF